MNQSGKVVSRRVARVLRGAMLLAAPGAVGTGCVCPSTITVTMEANDHARERALAEGNGVQLTPAECMTSCPPGVTTCAVFGDDRGNTEVRCNYPGPPMVCLGVEGRRPEGMEGFAPCSPSVTEHWTKALTMEAASVQSFIRLARELEHHGAPAPMVRAARRAARDEERHAAWCRSHLPEGTQVSVAAPDGAQQKVRALVDVARENAREGCVHETFSAAVAGAQAERAPSGMAPGLKRLAAEERAHALLSWRVHAWAMAQLGDAERGAVTAEMDHAREDVGAWLAGEVPQDLQALGIPDGPALRRMAQALDTELWGQAFPALG